MNISSLFLSHSGTFLIASTLGEISSRNQKYQTLSAFVSECECRRNETSVYFGQMMTELCFWVK